MDASATCATLKRRGVSVNGPATKADLEELRNVHGFSMDPFMVNIYSHFDGFEVYDDGMLTIWPIKDLLAFPSVRVLRNGETFISFGDYFIHEDLLLFCPYDMDQPVFYRNRGEDLAKSVPKFFERLARGEYDSM